MISHSTINTWYLILISEWLFLPVLYFFVQVENICSGTGTYLNSISFLSTQNHFLCTDAGKRKRFSSGEAISALRKLEYIWKAKIAGGNCHQFELLCHFFTGFVFYQELFLVSSLLPSSTAWWPWLSRFFPLLHCCGLETLMGYLILWMKHGRFVSLCRVLDASRILWDMGCGQCFSGSHQGPKQILSVVYVASKTCSI